MNTLLTYVPLLARILIAQIFLLSGVGKIGGFAQTAAGMADKGLPMAEVLLVVTIIIEIGGSLMILFGWRARIAALLLFLWMIPVTFVFHNFWAMPENMKMVQQIMFQKNLVMMGAMLYIVAFGPGPFSLRKD